MDSVAQDSIAMGQQSVANTLAIRESSKLDGMQKARVSKRHEDRASDSRNKSSGLGRVVCPAVLKASQA